MQTADAAPSSCAARDAPGSGACSGRPTESGRALQRRSSVSTQSRALQHLRAAPRDRAHTASPLRDRAWARAASPASRGRLGARPCARGCLRTARYPLAAVRMVRRRRLADDDRRGSIEKLRPRLDRGVADLLGLASASSPRRGQRKPEARGSARAWAQIAEVQRSCRVRGHPRRGAALAPGGAPLGVGARRAALILASPVRVLDVHPGWGGVRVRATRSSLIRAADREREPRTRCCPPRLSRARGSPSGKTEGKTRFVERRSGLAGADSGDGPSPGGSPTPPGAIAARSTPPPYEDAAAARGVSACLLALRSPAGARIEPQPCWTPPLRSPARGAALDYLGEHSDRFKHVLLREWRLRLSKSSAPTTLRVAGAEEHAGDELLVSAPTTWSRLAAQKEWTRRPPALAVDWAALESRLARPRSGGFRHGPSR